MDLNDTRLRTFPPPLPSQCGNVPLWQCTNVAMYQRPNRGRRKEKQMYCGQLAYAVSVDQPTERTTTITTTKTTKTIPSAP